MVDESGTKAYLKKEYRKTSALVNSSAPDLTQQQWLTFLVVAMNEGKSVTEITELSHGNRSTVSRHLLDLSIELRSKKEGFGLLTRAVDPNNNRNILYTLSAKGKRLVAEMQQLMED